MSEKPITTHVYAFDGPTLRWSESYTADDCCSGSGNGSLGEMCGGCSSCLIMQAEHGGAIVLTFEGDKPTDEQVAVEIANVLGFRGSAEVRGLLK